MAHSFHLLVAISLSIYVCCAQSKITCNKFTCKTPQQIFLPDTCAFHDNRTNTYYARKCENGLACYSAWNNGSYQLNYTCQTPSLPRPDSYPGEWCNSYSDCISSFSTACVNGICIGTPLGGQCQFNSQCQPGTYCKNKICTPQLKIGEFGCWSSFDCVNNAACNQVSYDQLELNQCLAVGSLKVHDEVGECYSGFNTLCPHVYCSTDRTTNKAYCSELFKTLWGPGAKCDLELKYSCYSNNDTFFNPPYSVEGSCLCGLNKYGYSFCGLLPGDAPYQSWTQILQQWQRSKEILKCNTMRRNEDNCVKTYWSSQNYNAFVYYYMNMQLYPITWWAEDCVIETFQENYYEARKAFQGNGDSQSIKVAAVGD